jgi:7-carboxy-7-deazaguanine synthase
MNGRFPISELYGPVVAGEGKLIGQQTTFIRFGFCDGAGEGGWCRWCDTLTSVDPRYRSEWRNLTTEEILREHAQLAYVRWVTLSGGNPLLHDLSELVLELRSRGHAVTVETQATVYRSWVLLCDYITLSPKPPSAGSPWTPRRRQTLERYFEACTRTSVPVGLKIVVDPDSRADRDFAEGLYVVYGNQPDLELDICFSCLTRLDDTRETLLDRYVRLVEFVRARQLDVAVLPQLHTLAYGHRMGV